jgi:TRAP-type C4-dicarboxylate transport system substrate-binding protein
LTAGRCRLVPWVAVFVLWTAWGLPPAGASAQTTGAKQPITVKMATLVPTNSSWFLLLKEVADKWNKLSNGRVRIILFGGATKGDDPEVVQTMRLGEELQGAVLTSVGLAEIEKSVYALSIPMAYDSYEEVYAVLDKMQTRLEAAVEANGFIVLNWADGGWVHFFTTKPVTTPDDLKKLKLFQWNGDTKSLEIWKAAGFNPRPASSTDLMTGLSTGLFEACSVSPQIAQISRYYETAKYMTDLNWALLMGATVIKKDTWAKIPADVKPALLEAMKDAATKLRADMRQSGEKDVAAMKTAGLTVVPVDAKTKELWLKTAQSAYGKVRGDFVPPDAFDEAMKYRDAFRKEHAATSPKK